LLLTLAQSPPPHAMLPTDIQGRILVTSGGLTKLLMQLESRGLVERWRSDDDRRVRPVRATEKGLALAEEAGSRLFRVTDSWIRSGIGECEARKLTNMLEQLTAAAKSSL
jgi:DNA-binding MarR family transcriptional regulator